MSYVYILRSLVDGNLYIGSTNDLRRRIKEHNSGKSFSTRFRKPFILVYYEAYLAEDDARRREQGLKTRGQALRQLRGRLSKTLAQDIS